MEWQRGETVSGSGTSGYRRLLPPLRGKGGSVVVLMAAQLVNLVAILLVTRLYSPGAYGRFATLFAIAVVVGGFSSLRLDVAATTAAAGDARVLLRVALRLNVAVALALVAAVALWQAVSGARGLVHGNAELFALGGVTATLGLSSTLVFARVRDRRYGLVAGSKLTVAVVQTVVQVLLGLVVPTAAAMLLAAALGYGAGAVLLMWRAGPASRPQQADPLGVLRRHRHFLVASAPANLIGSLATNVPVLVVGAAVSSTAAADLALALRVGALPSALLGQALMPILFGEIAHELRSSPSTALRSYDRALRWLAVVGAGSLTALALSVYWTAPLLLGPDWAGVGVALLLLTPVMIAQFAVTPLSLSLSAAGRTGQQFGWDVVRLVLTVAAFLPAIAGRHSLNSCLLLFSVALVFVYAGHVLLSRSALRNRQKAQVGALARAAERTRSGREHAHT